jgi:hypothetical protein
VFGDPYHWANLVGMHTAKGFARDTKNSDGDQIHHKQCLMSLQLLHSDDPGYNQTVMDRVMNGSDHVVTIRTWCEHQHGHQNRSI